MNALLVELPPAAAVIVLAAMIYGALWITVRTMQGPRDRRR